MSIIVVKDYDTAYFNSLQKEANKTPTIDPDTKIIFLDVDGVLNSNKWIKLNPNKSLIELMDPAAAARLNIIKERTGAKIVISSSWRIRFLGTANAFQDIKEFFAKFGIVDIVGMTPQLRGKRRCDEITAWLNEHEVKSFVIIDDDLSANVKNKQVKTMFENGLQDYHINEAIAILNDI